MEGAGQSQADLGPRRAFSLLQEAARNPSLLMLISELRRGLHGCRTVLDVGCGKASPLRFVPGMRLVGVDGYAPDLEEARRNRTHDEFVLGDVRQLRQLFPEKQFDACVALDVIEHLPKEDGWRMLEAMESLAEKRVIIFTPNGFMPQRSQGGDLQEHLSGWTPDEMQARGYTVFGVYGPKGLRGEYHRVRYSPAVFWVLVTFLGHYLQTRRSPQKSAAIFCVKSIQR